MEVEQVYWKRNPMGKEPCGEPHSKGKNSVLLPHGQYMPTARLIKMGKTGTREMAQQ